MGLICRLLGHDWKEVKREENVVKKVEKKYVGSLRLPSGRVAPIFTYREVEHVIQNIHYRCTTCGEEKIESVETK